MNYIKILLLTLFVSCSCQRIDSDLSVSAPELKIEDFFEPSLHSDSSAVNIDTTPEITASQVIQDTIIDSFSAGVTEKTPQKSLKTNNRKKMNTYVKKHIETPVLKGCSGLSGNPRTTEDAVRCSMHHWEIASSLLDSSKIDSAYIHCKRALSLYENGSLFYLKALLLNRKGQAAAALQAAEISLGRSDHWIVDDKNKSIIERCDALSVLYAQYPSSELKEKLKTCFWKY